MLELINDSNEGGKLDGGAVLLGEGYHLINNSGSRRNMLLPMRFRKNTILSKSDSDAAIVPTYQVGLRTSVESSRSY